MKNEKMANSLCPTGVPTGAPTSIPTKRTTIVPTAIIAMMISVLFLTGCGERVHKYLEPGQIGYACSETGSNVYIGKSSAVLNEYVDKNYKGNMQGVAKMIADKKMSILENCTQIKVHDAAYGMRGVEVLEGQLKGARGWIFRENALIKKTIQ